MPFSAGAMRFVLIGRDGGGTAHVMETVADRETMINIGKAILECARSLACNTIAIDCHKEALAVRPFADRPQFDVNRPDFSLSDVGLKPN